MFHFFILCDLEQIGNVYFLFSLNSIFSRLDLSHWTLITMAQWNEYKHGFNAASIWVDLSFLMCKI
jgi:hypothetical protein